MKKEASFFREVCAVAIPVALQSMLQSSFSMVDQIMIGQLGSVSIAAIGLAGKFSSIFSVIAAAVGTVAGIMISQYTGSGETDKADQSLSVNLLSAAVIALLFSLPCFLSPFRIMRLYCDDPETIAAAAGYLKIVAATFLPLAVTTCVSTMLRCTGYASLPLYSGIAAALLNTGLNYLLIFGRLGFPAMGVTGAGIATAAAGWANCLLTLAYFIHIRHKSRMRFHFSVRMEKMGARQYCGILFPILINEFLWSLGENVYASLYGHLGTDNCAAMTLTNPVQGLMIGALSGLSQAAGILIGKQLGKGNYEAALRQSRRLSLYALCGSLFLSVLLILCTPFYIAIYQVEPNVKATAAQILFVFALISPVKVQNMVVGGGILRSGGSTKLIMYIDIIGTWLFGVPLGLLGTFVLKLPIPYVYLLLSLEEVIRLAISFAVFKSRRWMNRL